ncbi:hypothetical protein [Maricaulis parjimensis]|uniref:hypothetical protein n=1 Tax=Maricaulis parjimensis TaxID=144023 RepID=UPI00193927A4|nr:hypothetical protein [Maricaulis parjimensis]
MRVSGIALRAFQGLVVLRAAYAILLCTGTLIFRFGHGNYIAIEETLGHVLMGLPLWYYQVWAGFVGLYTLSALLLVLRMRLALACYVVAFATDFILSLLWFQQPGMDRAYYGNANLVEWTLNAIDLGVISLMLLAGSWVFARPKKTHH